MAAASMAFAASVASAAAFRPAAAVTTRRAAVSRGVLQVRAGGVTSANDFSVGMNVEVDQAPWKVVEFMHVKPARGAAFVRSKLRNYLTGSVNEKTFRSAEKLALADVEKRRMQYSYPDGAAFIFMDMETFEETRIEDDKYFTKYLTEGLDVEVLTWNGKVIGVELPITVELEVSMTDPGVKGNTAAGGDKPATMSTGVVVTVPLFVQIGEKIVVDTREGKYISRVKKEKESN